MLSYREQGVFIGDRCGLVAVSCGFSLIVAFALFFFRVLLGLLAQLSRSIFSGDH